MLGETEHFECPKSIGESNRVAFTRADVLERTLEFGVRVVVKPVSKDARNRAPARRPSLPFHHPWDPFDGA
jgi:hypothetical protein